MPVHVVAGHLVVVAAPLAAVLALVYAGAPVARPRLGRPLVLAATLALGLVVWAGDAGGELLERVERTGSSAEVAAANAHAKGSDALAVAVFVLLCLAAACAWRLLRPGRPRTTGTSVAAGLLALAAAAVLVTTWTTTAQALDAVWDHHPSWTGAS